jgi:hypothetical protein
MMWLLNNELLAYAYYMPQKSGAGWHWMLVYASLDGWGWQITVKRGPANRPEPDHVWVVDSVRDRYPDGAILARIEAEKFLGKAKAEGKKVLAIAEQYPILLASFF